MTQGRTGRDAAGFTLIEVVLAVGLTAATVLTVFALIIPARDGAREAALAASAVRLAPTLEFDLQERGMEKVFVRVANGNTPLFGLYQVRIDPSVTAASPGPRDMVPSAKGNLGDDFTLTALVRDLADRGEVAKMETELAAVEGVSFVVRLGSDISNDIQRVPPGGSFSDFPSTVLVLNAEFIEVPSNLPVRDWKEFASRRRPVLTVPVTVRR